MHDVALDLLIEPGTILVAVGDSESIERLSQLAHPITQEGPIVVVGFGEVGQKVGEVIMDLTTSLSHEPDDALYICGTTNAVNRYYDQFPQSHQ